MKKATRRRGVFLIKIYQDKNDETKVAMFEEWKDEEAIELHNNSEHFTRICPQLSKYCVGDMRCDLFTRKSNKIDKGSAPMEFFHGGAFMYR
mgnify:CR=1 FL=1